jgi:hypothetical protein
MRRMLAHDEPLFFGRQEVRVPLIWVYYLNVIQFLCREIRSSKLCRAQKLIQRRLFRDAPHLDPACLGGRIRDILDTAVSLDTVQ